MSYLRFSSSIDWDSIWKSLNWDSSIAEVDVTLTLAHRAENYARPIEQDGQADDDALKALVFVQGQERYAIPVPYVMQGLTTQRITPLPCVPDYYRGVINVTGRILSVLDLRRFWGLPATDDGDGLPRLIVVRAAALEFALIVDDVLELASIPLREITPPVLAGVGLDHVQGVSPGGTVIIDVESLSSDRRLRVHEELQ